MVGLPTQRIKIFSLLHVEGSFYGLIQFLDLAGILRTHQPLQTVPWNGQDVV
jgi:hypothetical protein